LPRLKFVLAKAGIQKPIRNDGLFLSWIKTSYSVFNLAQ